MTRTRLIHYCNVCDYKTDRKYDRDKHVTRMHGSNVQQNASQAHEIGFNITQESIQHTYPNEDYNVNNIQNQAVGDDTASSSTGEDTPKVSSAMHVDMQHGDTDEESVDNSEQSEDMNDNEINNRAPTSVFKLINTPTYPSRILKKDGNEVEFTYGAAYYEF